MVVTTIKSFYFRIERCYSILSFHGMERGRKTKREKSCVIQSAKDNGGRTRGKNSGTEASTLCNIQSEKGPTKRKEQ